MANPTQAEATAQLREAFGRLMEDQGLRFAPKPVEEPKPIPRVGSVDLWDLTAQKLSEAVAAAPKSRTVSDAALEDYRRWRQRVDQPTAVERRELNQSQDLDAR